MINFMNAISWQVAAVALFLCGGVVALRAMTLGSRGAKESRELRHDEAMATLQIQTQKALEVKRNSNNEG